MAGGTGIEKEIQEFETILSAAIDNAMQNEVLDEVKDAMQLAIQERVYDAYQPSMYVRRGDGMERGTGALTDPDVMEHSYNNGTHTLVVRDMAKGGDPKRPDRAEQLLAPIIESGEGYTWERSEIAQSKAPRPFHEAAEEYLIDETHGVSFELRLVEGLQRNGMKATR